MEAAVPSSTETTTTRRRRTAVLFRLVLLVATSCFVVGAVVRKRGETPRPNTEELPSETSSPPSTTRGPPNTAAALRLEERLQALAAEVETLEEAKRQRQDSDDIGSTGGDAADGNSNSSVLQLLPACDELMQRPYSPYKDGGFLARHTTDIQWIPRTDGSRQLELQEICRLKRYSADEARQCLAHKHVAMIGDSITRYQYLSLAHLMEHGAFPPRFARPGKRSSSCTHIDESGRETCSTTDRPNICVESDWGNWDRYYDSLCGGTDGGILNGRMECHSFRIPPARKDQQLVCHENNLYVHGASQATLSFVFETGWGDDMEANLYGFAFTNCSYDGSCRRTPRDVQTIKDRTLKADYDFSQPFPEAIGANGSLRSLLPRPDFALYNRGVWGRLKEERAQTIFPMLRDWVANDERDAKRGGAPGGGKCYFKSTTAGAASFRANTSRTELHTIRPHAMYAGCQYLDVAYLTEPFASLDYDGSLRDPSAERRSVFVDQVHLQPWVYEELNQMLLNVLCNSNQKQ